MPGDGIARRTLPIRDIATRSERHILLNILALFAHRFGCHRLLPVAAGCICLVLLAPSASGDDDVAAADTPPTVAPAQSLPDNPDPEHAEAGDTVEQALDEADPEAPPEGLDLKRRDVVEGGEGGDEGAAGLNRLIPGEGEGDTPVVELAPLVRRLIDDPLTTDDDRTALRIRHGQWDELDEATLTPNQQAMLALQRWELDAEVLQGDGKFGPGDAPPSVEGRLLAEAALRRGEPERVLQKITLQGPGGGMNVHTRLLRARALTMLGKSHEAAEMLVPVREAVEAGELPDTDLTPAAASLALLARLEGRPAQDYKRAMAMLGRAHSQADPLDYDAMLAEARLLRDKENPAQAVAALAQALALNPKLGEAWLLLGLMSADSFQFDRAALAAQKLREINPNHPLADEVEARSLLQQRDPAGALAAVEAGLATAPKRRELLAMLAAAQALRYDEPAMRATLARLDELSPDSADPYYTVGEALSSARQYKQGAAMFEEAIRREPQWPAPRLELGLLLMQWGDLDAARAAFRSAVAIDPFHFRANNQLKLADELLGYRTIETPHFIIRFREGEDEALARDMPDRLEAIYRDITAAFEHEPAVKTQIDIMPDKPRFAVRITGMPDIWTIAACTGDVIALTPPKDGPDQWGPFNWPNVIRHEYVHTVTLGQTRNRLPHWFTEACAVSQETTGRTYDTCQLLAWALHHKKLFEYDAINWGFVRPEQPYERHLAYAQADWMLEYLGQRFGHRAIVQLLTLYGQGVGDVEALHQVTGLGVDEFMTGFRTWAGGQVQSWGLAQYDTNERFKQFFGDGGKAKAANKITDAQLQSLLKEHPGHPVLLELIARRAATGVDPEAARAAIQRYAQARPVDPWPYEALLPIALDTGRTDEAIASLQQLDRFADDTGKWAYELAKIHRNAERFDQALAAAERAIDREAYNAIYREQAATLSLQAGNLDRAEHHIRALTFLEPTRTIHHIRLAAVLTRLGRADDARAAAEAARAIDPDAAVEQFLQ